MQLFTYTPAEYQQKRDFNFVEYYIKDMALGLSKLEGIPLKEAEQFIREGIRDGSIPYHDPDVYALKRDMKGDKRKYKTKMTKFLREVEHEKHIIAPTLTCYFHPMKKLSETSVFTEFNVNRRNSLKEEAKVHAAAGRPIQKAMADNGQKNAKENNNSGSGALNSPANPIYNRSGHSTLTSVCRTDASMANSNTERFLAGKRHFMNWSIVVTNILAVLNAMDYQECQQVIDRYQLHYVTEEELLSAIKMSTDLYWRHEPAFNKIVEFVKTLTPLERTIYLYTGDFYHVRVFNESFVREIFDAAVHPLTNIEKEDPDTVMELVDDDMNALMAILLREEIKAPNDKGKLVSYPPKSKVTKGLSNYACIAGAIDHFMKAIENYGDFIRCFWRNDCLPMETGQMPDMVRTLVLGGDTDSTLFTVYTWVEWYTGKLNDDFDCLCTGATTVFFSSMMVKHYLAAVSGIMGIQKKRIHQMAMKNEFYFKTFMLTRRTKHYVAGAIVQEGVTLEETEFEIKGVGMKNRKAPYEVIQKAEALMVKLSDIAYRGEKISMYDLIHDTAVLEYKIYDSIIKGSTDYLKSESIKDASVYAKPMSSVYANYDLWEEVFAPKYGHAGTLPLQGVRVPLDLRNKTEVTKWIDSIKDEALKDRLVNWMTKHGKSGFSSIVLPVDVIAVKGIPREFRNIMDLRTTIFSLMETFYIILDSMNICMINDATSRLCLDEHPELFETEEDYQTFVSDLNNHEE